MSATAADVMDALPSLEPASPDGAVLPAVAPGSGFFPPGPVIVRVCMCCQSVLGWKSTEGKPKTFLSHGICPACAENWGKAA